jgi:ribosomal protein S18 acetylase RimI-like enzyme
MTHFPEHIGHPLDNPIWHALTSTHAHLAEGAGLARRYPLHLAPFAAVREQTPEGFAALARALDPEGMAALFVTPLEPPPPGWAHVRSFEVVQMTCEKLEPTLEPEMIELETRDVPEMLELIRLTEPGPFKDRANELGTFYGVHATDSDRDRKLVAMAGERIRLTGFTEISAVCTHPDFQRRGLARGLTHRLAREILARDEVPFLHVFAGNSNAIRAYESLGFQKRQVFTGVVIKSPEENL